MQLSTKIFIGLTLGIITGLFFGEYAGKIKVVGDIYISLLNMTVLPYILVSLIRGLGGLSMDDAKLIAKKCIWAVVMLWVVSVVIVLMMPLAFPGWEKAAFFSTSMIEQREAFDYLQFYIPTNIFYSLSNNLVPAVVIFSVVMGLMLITVKDKHAFLDALAPVDVALGKITKYLVNFAPYGVFAILASLLGVMPFNELGELQVFIVTYCVLALLSTFVIFPLLVTAFTPFSYNEITGPAKTSLFTAFATGNLFVVLPLLVDISKNLIASRGADSIKGNATVDVIIPVSYSLPSAGKLLSLGFVLFAGWLANADVPISDYASFAITGFFSFFGNYYIVIPTLLDVFQIPADTFRFFLISDNLIGVRFGPMLAAMFTLAVAILGAAGATGLLEFKWRKIMLNLIIIVASVFASLLATRMFFEHLIKHEYKQYSNFVSMSMQGQYPKATVYSNSLPEAWPVYEYQSRLDAISRRGSLRVGYYADALPFAFNNQEGTLVGYDVELAHILAGDLGVKPELVKIERKQTQALLNNGTIDIAMSSIAVTLERQRQFGLSDPYLSETFAMIVKDHRISEFNKSENLKKMPNLKIGALNSPYYLNKIKQYLPNAEIVILETPREFFTKYADELDAFAYSAEAGSAWSLIYPAFTVAIPYPDILEVPIAIGYPKGDQALGEFINTWILLRQKDKTFDRLYEQWILGKLAGDTEPRWSVIRDVLHWVK